LPLQDTLIVVPCHNEAKRLPLAAFEAFLAHTGPVGLILVDDGSSDGTPAMLNGLHQRFGRRCGVVTLPDNRGKAEAVRQGIHHALKAPNRPAWVGYWDADLSTPLSTIDLFRCFLRQNPQTHMVFGARVQLLGKDIRRSPWRHYPGRIFATLASMVLGLGVYDTQCGAKLFRTGPAIDALFADPFLSRWVFDVELVARWIRGQAGNGCLPPAVQAIYEYPLPRWHHVAGSKVSPGNAAEVLRDLWRIHRFLRA
jgi:glycosyltransferase involved in cell wall biosynthesis